MRDKIMAAFGNIASVKIVLEKIFATKKPRDMVVVIREGIGLARAYIIKALDALYTRIKLSRGTPSFYEFSEARRKIDILNYDLANLQIPQFPKKITDTHRVNVALFVAVIIRLAERLHVLALDKTTAPGMFLETEEKIREVMLTVPMLPFENASSYLSKLRQVVPDIVGDLELPAGKSLPQNIADIIKSSPGEIIELSELVEKLKKRGFKVNEKKVVDTLKKMGGTVISLTKKGPVVAIGGKAAREADQKQVLKLAMASEFLTVKKVLNTLDWTELRARVTLWELEQKGIAVAVHSYAEGDKWYFPSMR